MAIVRMNDLGMRLNGYAITAFAGDDCDACMIIHGSLDGSFDYGLNIPSRPPLHKLFLHKNGGLFDLTKLATSFDVDGGGHRDACGCRIKPLENGLPVERRTSNMTLSKTSSNGSRYGMPGLAMTTMC